MVCGPCSKKKHGKCAAPETCTCQHRSKAALTAMRANLPVYSERVAESISLWRPGALDLNADQPPPDC